MRIRREQGRHITFEGPMRFYLKQGSGGRGKTQSDADATQDASPNSSSNRRTLTPQAAEQLQGTSGGMDAAAVAFEIEKAVKLGDRRPRWDPRHAF